VGAIHVGFAPRGKIYRRVITEIHREEKSMQATWKAPRAGRKLSARIAPTTFHPAPSTGEIPAAFSNTIDGNKQACLLVFSTACEICFQLRFRSY
jgi:hypothetical protein